MNSSPGIPLRGAFERSTRTTADARRWRVPVELNRTLEATVHGGRKVRVYETRPRSYDAMFRASVARNPDAEAVVCGERRLSYGQLDELVQRHAHGLLRAGLRTGERVAVMLDNRLEYVVAVLRVA